MPYRRTGRPTGRPPYPGPLTPAEQRVLDLLRDDLTDAEIAEHLGVSRDTVHTHVNHMLAKLDLHDRRDLAAWQPERAIESRKGVAPTIWHRLALSKSAAVLAGGALVLAMAALAIALLFVSRGNDPGDQSGTAVVGATDRTGTPTPTVTATVTPSPLGGPNVTGTINATLALPLGGPARGTLAAASFIDPNRGWLAARRKIFQTLDSGQTWADVGSLDTAARRLLFVSATDGWAQAEGLWSTTDGGHSWQEIPVPGERKVGPFDLVDRDSAWVERAGGLYRTRDAGATWTSVPNPCDTPESTSAIDFVDRATGMLSCTTQSQTAELWRTGDGGDSWQRVDGQLPSRGLVSSLQFVDPTRGWASITLTGYHGIEEGGLYRTQDGGASWTQVLDATTVNLPSTQFVDTNVGFGLDGVTLYRTQDAGETWEVVFPRPHPFGALDFVDRQRGFGAGSYFDGPAFIETSDGGRTWTEVDGDVPARARWVDFGDESNGWLLADSIGSLHLYGTVDGGERWAPVAVPGGDANAAVGAISRVDARTGFVTAPGGLWRTDDGGGTFANVSGDAPSAISFASADAGWGVEPFNNPRDVLIATNDGGQTWTPVAAFRLIKDIALLPNGVGWLAAGNEPESLYRTNNNGATWTAVHIPGFNATTVAAVDADHAWITDQEYRVVATEDGGRSWSLVGPP